MSLTDLISQKLEQDLSAIHVEIVDNSWMHAGHAGAAAGGSHLSIVVVSPRFEGLPIMEQHRLVHQTLRDEMTNHIHAMELKTMSPTVWQQRTNQTA